MKRIFLFLIFFSLSILNAQSNKNLDSLYSALINSQDENYRSSISEEYIKCGFGLRAEAIENLNNFSLSQQIKIKKILQRPMLQASIVSPKGYFRIHYDSTGNDAINYNNLGVEQSLILLAQACDSSYNFEVNILGYPPPPNDNAEGGDNLYDIYVSNTGNSYGYTQGEVLISPDNNTYSSYIVIHNNFNSFPTKGINAARVTSAHEFFHAIQIGNYTLRYELDEFFYELSSTAMEEFVYDDVNDYYNYLPYYFNNTENAFGCISCSQSLQEYALAVWNIFLKDVFGFGIIKRQWELMPQMRAMQAINISLQEKGSSFRSEFTKFGMWIYFTGLRNIPGEYFDEASVYPMITPITTLVFDSPAKKVSVNAKPTSQNFIRFINPLNNDTLFILVSNSDVIKGIDSLNSMSAFEYSLFNSFAQGRTKLNDNYYSSFTTNNPNFWSETVILNNIIIKEDTSVFVPGNFSDYAYPNPFYYSKNYSDNSIRIPVKAGLAENVDFNIYSSAMELVFSSNERAGLGEQGNVVIKWIPKDYKGKKLASGVYIFFTKSGDKTTTGKIVIFK